MGLRHWGRAATALREGESGCAIPLDTTEVVSVASIQGLVFRALRHVRAEAEVRRIRGTARSLYSLEDVRSHPDGGAEPINRAAGGG